MDDIRKAELDLRVEGEDGFVLEGHSLMSEISRDPLDLVTQTVETPADQVKLHMRTTARRVRLALDSQVRLPFRIVTNQGREITTTTSEIELEGDAPIQVRFIFYKCGTGEFQELEPTWISPTRWRAQFALAYHLRPCDEPCSRLGRRRRSWNFRRRYGAPYRL